MTKRTAKKNSTKKITRERAGHLYVFGSKKLNIETLGPQQQVIVKALKTKGSATAKQLAEKLDKKALDTVMKPIQVISYHLGKLKSAGFLKFGGTPAKAVAAKKPVKKARKAKASAAVAAPAAA